ncbi:sulfite reductase subunit alpha [Bacillus sp. B1-b2]|uniref:sulfite reductase subunit alpha n=1 Tax=Bacillus sp. B1-b2 TaxID=2653201 RepID=UPI0012615E2E|nr:sulfite reductase subunit alpha [Bacillus sp. B1-b2]KAB7672631.1 sulfite reductase subunit alpha [Bacillus sp. B1-b2]
MQNNIVETNKTEVIYSRKNPFPATVLKNINLNLEGSNRETRHLELSLKGSGFTYNPGDTLGIVPENEIQLVEELISEMKWDGEALVPINKLGEQLPLKEALTTYFEITLLTKKILQTASNLTDNEEIKNLVAPENAAQLKEYMYGRDVLDMLRDFGPWNTTAEEFVTLLRKMPPRLYSISSSLAANPDEVHLTISAVRYNSNGRDRSGVCSVQCAERIAVNDTLPIFIQTNKHFHLPESEDVNIIMVGPGTGIAPFRAFIQELSIRKGSGKSWLFFGAQHSSTDYLYQEELEKFQQDNVLTHLTTAFSRDTEEKVYVQHRMLENSKELYEWIQGGAHFYVCGDKEYMAKDVNEALITIVEKEGNLDREAAEAYVTEMQKSKRYQKDVY